MQKRNKQGDNLLIKILRGDLEEYDAKTLYLFYISK